jgi:hypothetical protein
MTGLKITDLSSLTSGMVSPDDVLPIVDTSMDTLRKIRVSDLLTLVGSGGSGVSSFTDLTNKPTTIGGYGITDAYTISQMDQILQAYSPNISYANSTTDGMLYSSDWNAFNSKQPMLVSGTNIKTVNGTSVLGSGDIVISSGASVTKNEFIASEGQVDFVCTGITLLNPMVFLNGVLQSIDNTYTYSGSTVTFLDARTLNDNILILN